MRFKVEINQEQAYPVIRLIDTITGCIAEIFAFGGILNAFHIPLNGNTFNCIDGFSSVMEAQESITTAFKSAKISPFVCRLHKGTYQLNGENYTIQKNYLGEHALHGLIYDAVYELESTNESDTAASILLIYHYAKNDAGYPFTFDISLRWELSLNNTLAITTSISHQNKDAIPYADGWHPYFNLGGPIDQYSLQFDSDTMLEFDADLIPTGKKIKDNRFIEKYPLNEIFLDNSFELAANGKCLLSNDQFQLKVIPDENYPILQVYTPDHRNSIAIENLSGAPDNFNNGIGLLMLSPNKEYQFKTSYQITTL
ncbi:aldose 1-epimerase [Sediminibacterium sp.]|uniref:aldose 1-epimerase n=1 Tax=Sediminibacterium sp. TaxID=1917865 RepID=UPI003F728EE8